MTFSHMNLDKKLLKKSFSILLPALLVVGITLYLLSLSGLNYRNDDPLEGKPLIAYPAYYPIESNKKSMLYLDKNKFIAACDYFTLHPNPKAIADLIYLGQANDIASLLEGKESKCYQDLMLSSPFVDPKSITEEKGRIFQNYIDIANAIAVTTYGTDAEIVVYDVRNPLRSVVLSENSLAGPTQIGTAISPFGLKVIKNYALYERTGSSFTSFLLTGDGDKKLKSTVIPLFNKRYGLVGLMWINIDITKFGKSVNSPEVKVFLQNYAKVVPNDRIEELIKLSKSGSLEEK